MSRSAVVVRPAEAGDVANLRDVWADVLRRGTIEEQLTDVAAIVTDVTECPNRAVAVAEYDGEFAGAVYLEAGTLTPINLERSVLAVSPHVVPSFRRKGVGSALMEAAVSFADQRGIGHVASAAESDGRDANRFMARLSLAPKATLRVATTSAVRARLSARRPLSSAASGTTRHIDRVLAARRIRRERVSG